jgi:hypothetical protein
MSNIQQINPVISGVPGSGNKLVSFLKTGFVVDADLNKEIFNFSRVDSRAHAKFLTNLDDAGRIGNSLDFEARTIGVRLIKIGATAPTVQELHDMKKYLASLEIKVKVGSDDKPAGDFTGLQFTDPQEFSAIGGSGDTLSGVVNPSSQKGEVNLPVPVLIQRGWEIKGEVKSTLSAVPSTLRAASEEWVVEIFLVGFKQTY